MRSAVWVALLRHLPPEQHDQIMLVTAAGTEIAIGGILRLDREFVVFKGRLSGSQESGRVFFIPYDQIDYLGFQKPLKDTEFHALFDNLTIPDAPAEQPAAPDFTALAVQPTLQPSEAPLAVPAPAAQATAANGASAASLPRVPIKSAVLERFRARSSSPGLAPPTPTD